MPKSAATRASDIPAKERILKAAIRRFARHSYEDTGLRDIANDADVDVAYVHRSFGSKDEPPRVCRRLQLPNRMEP